MRPSLRPAVVGLAVGACLTAAACLTLAACGTASRSGPSASPPAPATAASAPDHLASSRAGVTAPPVNGRFDYQIGGAYRPAAGVTIVDRDRGDQPAAGIYSICYVNAFQSQPEDKSFWLGQHPDLLVQDNGKPVEDPDWPGEYLLDTSTAAHRTALASIVGGWIDGCGKAGFRAVEPDNLDSWTRSKGHLTKAANLAFASVLIARAHGDGLAIAQKNTVELSAAGRRAGFDFAVAEECQVYGECSGYTDVYGDHVIEIEYTDNPRKYYTAACSVRGAHVSVILRDRDVVPAGEAAYRYENC